MTERLHEKKCSACYSKLPLLTKMEMNSLLIQLPHWLIEDDKVLTRHIKTTDFKSSLDLGNQVGAIAEEEGHHPDLQICWGKLTIKTWTHASHGLTENDFILAAKIDKIIA